MITFLENCKRYANVMVALGVVACIFGLVLLELIASISDGFPVLPGASGPPDSIPQVSSPCSVIDDITICPEGVEPGQ